MPSDEAGAEGALVPLRVLDRYLVFEEIASGGMATVHLGRLRGPAGFGRTVALKRLLPQYARVPEFLTMFLDEARLASRIRHPNVVSVLDVVKDGDDFFLVMEYIHGQSLARIKKAHAGPLGAPRALAIAYAMLHGLHAAHEATGEDGAPLEIVHRDVSPQNVLVGLDGIARVVDFGIAKANVRLQTTRHGQLKGKLPYMAPEQLRGDLVTRKSDVYSVGVVLWEMLTGERLFVGDTDAAVFGRVLEGKVAPPSTVTAGVPAAIDALVLRALDRDVDQRFDTARDMAQALEGAGELAPAAELGSWLHEKIGEALARRAELIKRIERAGIGGDVLEEARSAVRRRTDAFTGQPPASRAWAAIDDGATADAESASRELRDLARSLEQRSPERAASAAAPPTEPSGRRRWLPLLAPTAALGLLVAAWFTRFHAPERAWCRTGVAAQRSALVLTSQDPSQPAPPSAALDGARREQPVDTTTPPDATAAGATVSRTRPSAVRRARRPRRHRRAAGPRATRPGSWMARAPSATSSSACNAGPRGATIGVMARAEAPSPSKRSSAVRSLPWTVTLALTCAVSGVAHAQPAADEKRVCAQASESAQELRAAGKLRKAREQLVTCVRETCPAVVRTDCGRWMGEVDALIPTVVLGARDASGRDVSDVTVRMDGEVLAERLGGQAVAVDPGEHVFRFEPTGVGEPVEQRVVLREGEKGRSLVVALPAPQPKPAAPPPSPPDNTFTRLQSYLPYALLGLGISAIGAGVVYEIAGTRDIDELRDTCKPNCKDDDVDDARRELLVGDIAIAAGVLAVGAAVYLFVNPPGARERGAGSALAPKRRGVSTGWPRRALSTRISF